VGMILQGEKPHEKFQQIDYLALQMITAGAFGINKPIICSGANLAFKKKSFIETSNAIPGPHYLSVDDVFLLSAFKNQSFKVIYLKSAQALVKTTPCDSIPEFLRQRMRWGGKSMAYTDPFARTTVFIMFGTNAYLAVLSVILFLSPAHIWLWPAAIFLKTMADWTLLKPGFGFFPGKAKPITILISELIYPFYILITGLGSLIFKEQWKDRTGK
jgi:cellulose synthase/poly-beta-1,6-N-acetylglucosamine synthase-like glycosyltransferase